MDKKDKEQTQRMIELTKENMRDVFWGIIVINLFVIVCIITLLIATKLIIIDPIIKRKKKK